MNYIYIGKIVNTHGIKGELRIISDFYEKELIFKSGFKLYITPLYIEEEITSYRRHKNFDQVILKNYSNINEVLKYVGSSVYINRDDLNFDDNEYLLQDLIGYDVYDEDNYLGKVKEITNNNNILLKISGNKEFFIPFIDEFIENVDVVNKRIETINGGEFII